MKIHLGYGKAKVGLEIPDKNVIGILEPTPSPILKDLFIETSRLLYSPTAGFPLDQKIRAILVEKKQCKVVVIINDLTRATPNEPLLTPLLDFLNEKGVPSCDISIVIATGTHRPLSKNEMAELLGKNYGRVPAFNSDCDAPDMVFLGRLSSGNELWVNPIVTGADLRIAIGEIGFHYFAGFSGGRKSLLPGVCGRKTIVNNHALLLDPGAQLGVLEKNPVNEEMEEALGFCPLHFIINVVLDSNHNPVHIVAGDPVEAWKVGVVFLDRMQRISLPRRGEIAIASAGGFPKDISFYQTQKTFEMAGRSLKRGGTLIVCAECTEGLGNPALKRWADQKLSPPEMLQKFPHNFELGGHKLYYLAKQSLLMELVLFSSLDDSLTKLLFCRKANTLQQELDFAINKHGKDAGIYIIPSGTSVLPVCSER